MFRKPKRCCAFFSGLLLLLLLAGTSAHAQPRALPGASAAASPFQDCSDCPSMVRIAGGGLLMGSPAGEAGRFDAEGPQHPVTVKPFAMGAYDVTIEQFLAFLRDAGYQPQPCDTRLNLGWASPGKGIAYAPAAGGTEEPPRQPATCLDWDDAQAYIAWLNHKVGGNVAVGKGPYRLPSEAEWEYAARAGTTTTRWWGDAIGKNNADCDGCGSRWDNTNIAPTGSFGPNPFGLYDMLGSVWQWVADCWHPSYQGAPTDGSAWMADGGGDCGKRVERGGSWDNLPTFVRSAARAQADAHGADFDYAHYAGFRLARSLP